MRNKLWTPAVLLALPMMLAACGTASQATDPGIPTASGKAAACLSMAQISPDRGKPKEAGPITTEEIASLLDRDHPVDRVRNLVGDTTSTLTQVDKNNAALAALCGK